MSGSVIRNAIVDLRRMALRSAKRRRPPPAIEGASTSASTMLTLLPPTAARAVRPLCPVSHRERDAVRGCACAIGFDLACLAPLRAEERERAASATPLTDHP